MRFGGGMGAAIPQLLAGRIDVAFGRTEGLGRSFPAELTRRLVRYEPLALLVADDHPHGCTLRRAVRQAARNGGRR
jgi:hypothetical protein